MAGHRFVQRGFRTFFFLVSAMLLKVRLVVRALGMAGGASLLLLLRGVPLLFGPVLISSKACCSTFSMVSSWCPTDLRVCSSRGRLGLLGCGRC